jgi:hypothetical protein
MTSSGLKISSLIFFLGACGSSSSTPSIDAATSDAPVAVTPDAPTTPPDAPAIDAPPPPVDAAPIDVALSPDVVVHAPTNAKLVYMGGPVISHVGIVEVEWGTGVDLGSAMAGFYGAITNGPYVDWLSEYDTPTQNIGRGHLVMDYVDTSAPAGTAFTDADVQAELTRLIAAGSVPAPDDDTLFVVHFPPGVTVTFDGLVSCVGFCDYHSNFISNSRSIRYVGMPDQGGACAAACGTGSKLDVTTENVSGILLAAITNPDIGTNSIGWYDTNNGEIEAICNTGLVQSYPTVGGYAVSLGYSDARKMCVTGP